MVSIRFTGSQFATGVRILGALGLVSSAGAALALKGYVGNSYLQIPGVEGSWVGTAYTNSLKGISKNTDLSPICLGGQ
jgi:hypothetical protein